MPGRLVAVDRLDAELAALSPGASVAGADGRRAARGACRRPTTSATTTTSGAGRSTATTRSSSGSRLEAFQSGLSWLTILRKREASGRRSPASTSHAVAAFDDADVARLLADAGIVRNRRKIEAAIANARAAADARRAAWTTLLWSLRAGRRPPGARRASPTSRPTTAESTALAKELKRHGFRFVGPTTAYALMQATGLVNDHLADCWARDRAPRVSTSSTTEGLDRRTNQKDSTTEALRPREGSTTKA